MTGTVDSCNVSSASERQNTSQQTLTDYQGGEETFVNIVHSSNNEIEEVTDERDRRLAPPTGLFEAWLEKRNKLRGRDTGNGMSPHNKAYDAVNYRERFREDLDEEAVEEYAERVRAGEHIVFVCYCGNGQYCHRRIVKECVHDALKADGGD